MTGNHNGGRLLRASNVTAVALAVALPAVIAYLAVAPPAADLAAATYRSDLFARAGFTTWDTGWYAAHGHYVPAYSLLAPALGALLGVRVLLALSTLAACLLFGLVAQRSFGIAQGRPSGGTTVRTRTATSAQLASAVFALGACVAMLSGRVPFQLGLAIGLGAVLAFMEAPLVLALAFAVLTSLASPVAGVFLALAAIALAIGGRRAGLGLAAAALIPIAVLSLAYPEGGYEPFAPSAFWPALAGVLAIAALLPRGALSPQAHRTVRTGAALYAVMLVAAFAIHTPMGGNAARLGPLLAAPLLAGLMWEHRRTALLAIAPLLLYWQLVTPIRDLASIANDPSVHASYYAPLLGELRRLDHRGRPTIVEVPLTKAHWEAAYLAGHDGIRLARGWERQLDTRYSPLFYEPPLTPAAYRAWLRENRVSYVALPDPPRERGGRAQGRLIARGLPYLREIWRTKHWRLFRFMG